MAQFDFGTLDPATVSGTALASDLTSWRDALNSAHSGNAAPTYAITGMSWLDTSTTPWALKRYDGTSWVILGTVNPTTHIWTPAISGAISGPAKAIAATDTASAMSPNDVLAQQLANPVAIDASGTANAFTATIPAAPQTALADRMRVRVRAAAANSGAATFGLTLGTVDTGAVPVRKGALAPLEAGDIAGAGHELDLQYNAMAGVWLLLNPAVTAGTAAGQYLRMDASGKIPAGTDGSQLANLPNSSASCLGAFRNLALSATGADASVSMSADEIVVADSSHQYKTLRGLSLSASTGAAGAGGLDSGTIASGTWYAVWLIHNATTSTAALLLSLSATAPTLPSGYTYSVRVGWIRTDGTANKYPLAFVQYGRKSQYKLTTGSNLTRYPTACSGTQGTVGSVYMPISLSACVPATATAANLMLISTSTTYNFIEISPNNSASAVTGSISGPIATTSGNTVATSVLVSVLLETNTIYVAEQTNSTLAVTGWEDNI